MSFKGVNNNWVCSNEWGKEIEREISQYYYTKQKF